MHGLLFPGANSILNSWMRRLYAPTAIVAAAFFIMYITKLPIKIYPAATPYTLPPPVFALSVK